MPTSDDYADLLYAVSCFSDVVKRILDQQVEQARLTVEFHGAVERIMDNILLGAALHQLPESERKALESFPNAVEMLLHNIRTTSEHFERLCSILPPVKKPGGEGEPTS